MVDELVIVEEGKVFEFEWEGQPVRVHGYASVNPKTGVIWNPPNYHTRIGDFIERRSGLQEVVTGAESAPKPERNVT